MLKIEFVWRELLFRSIENKNPNFTLTELSERFNLSTSVTSHALRPLRQMRIVEVAKTRSKVVDAERLLFYWATRRNLIKDIIYETYSKLSIKEREASMPSRVYPTAYSAVRLYFPDKPLPADYDHSYFYATDITEIKERFPPTIKKSPNIYILRKDPYLNLYEKTPLAQIFVDLWNLPEWYAKEFGDEILDKIRGKIGL